LPAPRPCRSKPLILVTHMTVFSPLSTQPVFLNGQIQVGAIVNVYNAGTLTPRTVYKDGQAQTPWAQATPGSPPPAGALVTDASGTIPPFWVVGNPFRVRITSAGGVQIRDVDNLPGDTAQGGGGGGGGSGASLKTGDYVFAHTTAVITGRVRANGRTIGNSLSGATEFADPSTQNLFVFLWNADPFLAVSGGRGANALADFNANKTLTLPDLNGRTLFGIDGMGTSTTHRLDNAFFISGSTTALGSTGGEGLHVLAIAEMPTHTHTGTTQANASFQMTFTTGATSAGTPAGTIDTQGLHSHTGQTTTNGSHNHAGSFSDSIGSHSHGGATGTEGATHSHSGVGTGVSVSTVTLFPPAGGSLATLVTAVALQTGSSNTESTTHTHAISADGLHQHVLAIATDGSHFHGIAQDGSHNHNFTGTALPAHQHSGSTDAGGVHTHAFTSNASGNGQGHNNMPPFVLATCYIVL
jgi:hypothetical protein